MSQLQMTCFVATSHERWWRGGEGRGGEGRGGEGRGGEICFDGLFETDNRRQQSAALTQVRVQGGSKSNGQTDCHVRTAVNRPAQLCCTVYSSEIVCTICTTHDSASGGEQHLHLSWRYLDEVWLTRSGSQSLLPGTEGCGREEDALLGVAAVPAMHICLAQTM